MAHKIIAADLGSSCIKLARFDASFRKLTLLDAHTVPVGGASVVSKPDERIPAQLAVLAQIMAEGKEQAEEIAIGLPGDVLTFRLVDLPFANPRQIEQTIGYELESVILAPVEELVVDFLVLGPARGPGGTASPETRVLAACAPKALVERVVKAAQELALPLRTVGASPLAYAALLATAGGSTGTGAAQAAGAPAAQAQEQAEGEAAPPPPAPSAVLVVDVGSDSTTVCALRDGRPEFARTIARGGRHVTDAIAAAFKLDADRAEAAKIDAGFVAVAAMRATQRLSASQTHMDGACREALAPLVRELRQTIASYRATWGDAIEKLLVTGGGSRLAGIVEHLGEELGLPSERLRIPPREGWAEDALAGERKDVLSVAVGLALGATTPGTQVNFRKGEFAYRSDYSFLRDKARYFAIATALVLAFAGVNALTSLRGLRKEHDLLSARLKKATVEVFGKERDDAASVSEEIKAGPKGIGQLPIPSMTALDILDEMSRVVPPPDKIRLDILDLDIRAKKTVIRATTETAQQVDDFTDALKKIDCFEDVQKGKLETITVAQPYVPPMQPIQNDQQQDKDQEKDKGPSELKQFTVNIKTSCP